VLERGNYWPMLLDGECLILPIPWSRGKGAAFGVLVGKAKGVEV